MKAFLGLLLALVLSVPGGEALAQITDLNSAINKAGRQRMLSPRMAKAYFQIGQQVEVDRSKKILDASVSLFDRQLVEPKNFATTPESVNAALGSLEKGDAQSAWKDGLAAEYFAIVSLLLEAGYQPQLVNVREGSAQASVTISGPELQIVALEKLQDSWTITESTQTPAPP